MLFRSIYVNQLLKDGSFTKDDIEEHRKWVWGMLEESFAKSKDYMPTSKEWTTSAWNGFKSPKELAMEILPHSPTGIAAHTLEHIATVIGTAPEGFNVHRNLKRILANRVKTVQEGKNIDWSTAEALAFGSLVSEGHHVRVSGQDVERGTFSQRHAVFHDQETEATYTPLQHVSKDQGKFVISNSSLSEFGALGFEYGYSLSSPNALVMWEAQFGDFANNAQCIIDQFVASGEVKWMQRSGLVMSLPHGYDGQGPEHSSGRMERYLQLCNEDPRVFPSPDKLDRQHQDCNMQIAYMTTPSNLFHILRRQMHRQFRKRKFFVPRSGNGPHTDTLQPLSSSSLSLFCVTLWRARTLKSSPVTHNSNGSFRTLNMATLLTTLKQLTASSFVLVKSTLHYTSTVPRRASRTQPLRA